MIRVAALTSGRHVPSSRYRIRQHIQPLAECGIAVREYCPAIERKVNLNIFLGVKRIRYIPPLYPFFFALEAAKFASLLPGIIGGRWHDAVWLERGLWMGYPTLENALKKPLVLDVDDAVWQSPPFGEVQMKRTARRADRIVVGNGYLADWFRQFNKKVIIVPTAVDTDRFRPSQQNGDRPFTVGWIGTSGNFTYLYEINNALRKFFMHAQDAHMLVIADAVPKGIDVPPDRLQFVKWSEENEATMIQKMDVGLMPLADDQWTRGKCSFKMLQYMACAKPVIVSPVGMNAEVLAKGSVGFGPIYGKDWLDSLVHLYESPTTAERLGQIGRNVVICDYSREVVSKALAAVFQEVG